MWLSWLSPQSLPKIDGPRQCALPVLAFFRVLLAFFRTRTRYRLASPRSTSNYRSNFRVARPEALRRAWRESVRVMRFKELRDLALLDTPHQDGPNWRNTGYTQINKLCRLSPQPPNGNRRCADSKLIAAKPRFTWRFRAVLGWNLVISSVISEKT